MEGEELVHDPRQASVASGDGAPGGVHAIYACTHVDVVIRATDSGNKRSMTLIWCGAGVAVVERNSRVYACGQFHGWQGHKALANGDSMKEWQYTVAQGREEGAYVAPGGSTW